MSATFTVEQEVEAFLRLALGRYIGNAYQVEAAVPSTSDFHQEVIAKLEDIIQAYTTPVSTVPASPTLEDWAKIPVGAKLGFGREGTFHPYVKFDEDTYGSPGYRDDARRIQDGTPGDLGRGLHWQVDDGIIRVGDTVRVKDNYPWGDLKGEEFTVENVVRSRWTSQDGVEYKFYVEGDEAKRGVWDYYIEKVSK